jgi:hypothetical protein
MGPPPGGGSSRGGSGGMSGMSGMGRGGFGGSGADAADPYAYRLDPVYRKLRYEIGCAMKGLRGIDVYRSGDGPGGLYRAQLTPEDKEYIGRAAMALRDVGDKLRKKTDELTTKAFVVEKLDLDKLTKLTNEVVAKAKPKAAGPELKDPLSEPDPADDVLPPEDPEAKTTAAGKKKK